jgi:hypothetical protein
MMKNINEQPHINPKTLNIFIIISIILTTLLYSCNYPTSNNTIHPDRSQSLTQYSTPYVTIQFNLSLPQPLSSGETVNIVVLDEVTGLPYNRQIYEMDQVDENLFTATLSIPLFSVIKYRYEKFGESVLPEKKTDGQNVRYRMYFVEQSGVVNDYLSSWDGVNRPSILGQFTAVVYDHESGKPIPDILVSAGGQLNFTDANGLVNFYGLPPGTHNILFYAINGQYQTYQQGARISEGKITPAEVKLSPNKPIEVTFIVTPPNDAVGAPVYLAGNFIQFGNTFTDLLGTMSIDPKRMVVLSPQDDGKLTGLITLYSGTDFRFKFTLGDGYWNTELNSDSESLTRQLIVPDQDIVLELNIAAWRAPVFEPITFKTFIHPNIGYPGERYIQFKKDGWTEPIPLWPLGNGNYLYILYSPFEITTPITYRVCLTRVCNSENSSLIVSPAEQVNPADQPLTRTITVDQWTSPPSTIAEDNITEIVFPYKADGFQTYIELSPEMSPTWFSSIPIALESLEEVNSEILLLSPLWVQNEINGYLQSDIGTTPFSFEMMNYISQAQAHNFEVGLFPQIGPLEHTGDTFDWTEQNDAWQEDWFNSYRQFILNYAKIAENSGAKKLIIGGKPLLASLPDANPVYTQESLNEDWRALIGDIREQFGGKLLWAANAGTQMDPLPSFINLFDEIYISVDSPLTSGSDPSFDEIAYGFTTTVDNLLYEVYRSTFIPVTIAFAYPSVEGAAQGCQLIGNDCNNDGLFIQDELSGYKVDGAQQALIYSAILPIAASREWITGISVRGYMPLCNPEDSSSSISCKPAQDVIQYWYTGLTNDW